MRSSRRYSCVGLAEYGGRTRCRRCRGRRSRYCHLSTKHITRPPPPAGTFPPHLPLSRPQRPLAPVPGDPSASLRRLVAHYNVCAGASMQARCGRQLPQMGNVVRGSQHPQPKSRAAAPDETGERTDDPPQQLQGSSLSGYRWLVVTPSFPSESGNRCQRHRQDCTPGGHVALCRSIQPHAALECERTTVHQSRS